jgi:alpha-mannosidase
MYNGTYAQPHLQVLSSEANLRQFELGARVYREAGLEPVTVYAHQEASVHDQAPQLLKAFGYRFAVVPGFLSTLAWLEQGELVLHGVRGPRFVQGHEFAAWQGLDGTQIPLYLHQPAPREYTLKETLVRESVLASLRVPTLLVDLPDMIAIDDAWMTERENMDFVLLERALEQRLKASHPPARARLYTHWSYLEGIRAEELSRRNWRAEEAALRAEAMDLMAAVLIQRPARSTGSLWKTILAAQHHDVYCFSAPELRDKAIGWLKEAEGEADQLSRTAMQAIAVHVDTTGPEEACVLVFNTLPHRQTGLVDLEVDRGDLTVVDGQGELVTAETLTREAGKAQVKFIAELPGFGYRTYWLRQGGGTPSWTQQAEPLVFENDFYRATVQLDGTFSALSLRPGGEELLDGRRGRGNRLSATDSREISLKAGAPEEEYLQRHLADPPVCGPALKWEPDGPAQLLSSPLGETLSVRGKLGESITAEAIVRFYRRLPHIDLTWRFVFHQASIGTFFDEESKLLVRWPLGFTGEISHDIPFGMIRTREERSFFPTRWVDVSDGRAGLAFFHCGTPHFWVSGGTLFNLIAWGEETDAIHNGLGRHRWLKSFDQRLNGTHTIHYALYPHNGDWKAADVIGAARDYGSPLVALQAFSHPGALPPARNILTLKDPALAATALFACGGQGVCRGYAGYGERASGEVEAHGIRPSGLHSLVGEGVSELAPFQIGELLFSLE